MSDGQDDWIKWQMSNTGDESDIKLWPPKDMSEHDIKRICALYIMINLAVWGIVIGMAIIAGIILWFCGAL